MYESHCRVNTAVGNMMGFADDIVVAIQKDDCLMPVQQSFITTVSLFTLYLKL